MDIKIMLPGALSGVITAKLPEHSGERQRKIGGADRAAGVTGKPTEVLALAGADRATGTVSALF
jgi:hypothetical protein